MKKRILLIDDEDNVRKMIQLALTHEGYEVEAHASGETALSAVQNGGSFELALVDQRLPGMPGIEVQEELKKIAPSIRVIMITAFGSFDLALEAIQMGASEFLRKPFTIDTLRLAVQSALDRPVRQQEAVPIGTICQAFTRTTINGYSFTIFEDEEHHESHGDNYEAIFKVKKPSGESAKVTVTIPNYIQELVKAKIDAEEVPGDDAFWQAMAEEALADHLWLQAELPAGGQLRVEDVSVNIERWMNAVLTFEVR